MLFISYRLGASVNPESLDDVKIKSCPILHENPLSAGSIVRFLHLLFMGSRSHLFLYCLRVCNYEIYALDL